MGNMSFPSKAHIEIKSFLSPLEILPASGDFVHLKSDAELMKVVLQL